ncbi:hypothetical protein K2X14_14065 [Acetobacter sp. TBRC 12305]|uniref:Uncharacterized protein n=1 Tax=Acetobacter garciniae TaxID=2817435 RepID=A0A939HLN7_9PROT|nr:hypothetical protein [Acetobacter garciniae]MBO1326743.1 hypothetical protein [Acetobacter garciniae]MBX0345959.1 hypothetical protein [Acetobacter garciniae]
MTDTKTTRRKNVCSLVGEAARKSGFPSSPVDVVDMGLPPDDDGVVGQATSPEEAAQILLNFGKTMGRKPTVTSLAYHGPSEDFPNGFYAGEMAYIGAVHD